MHAILATWPIECYSYSYCVGGSGICMLILCNVSVLSLDHDFHEEVKAGQNCCQSHYHLFWDHYGLAKYCTVWGTFSRHFLLNAFSLACAIWIVNVYIKRHSHFLANLISPQQPDCRENWIYAYRIYQFSLNKNPTSNDIWIPLFPSAKLNTRLTEINLTLADCAFHHHLAKILMIK